MIYNNIYYIYYILLYKQYLPTAFSDVPPYLSLVHATRSTKESVIIFDPSGFPVCCCYSAPYNICNDYNKYCSYHVFFPPVVFSVMYSNQIVIFQLFQPIGINKNHMLCHNHIQANCKRDNSNQQKFRNIIVVANHEKRHGK